MNEVEKCLMEQSLPPHLMIDCSHGNSLKDYRNQCMVVNAIAKQIEQGSRCIAACMVESNLVAGAQKLGKDPKALTYGQSITDQCIDWPDTVEVLDRLAAAVRERRN